MLPPKRQSNLLRNLLIFLAAVVPVAVLLGPKLTYQRYLNDSLEEMDDYGRQIWEDMHKVPIDIPEEWLEEPNFPEDLLATAGTSMRPSLALLDRGTLSGDHGFSDQKQGATKHQSENPRLISFE